MSEKNIKKVMSGYDDETVSCPFCQKVIILEDQECEHLVDYTFDNEKYTLFFEGGNG